MVRITKHGAELFVLFNGYYLSDEIKENGMDRYVYLKWWMWELHAENLKGRNTHMPRLQ
jgi:hypothetical protein